MRNSRRTMRNSRRTMRNSRRLLLIFASLVCNNGFQKRQLRKNCRIFAVEAGLRAIISRK
jgi:hypothetical protein